VHCNKTFFQYLRVQLQIYLLRISTKPLIKFVVVFFSYTKWLLKQYFEICYGKGKKSQRCPCAQLIKHYAKKAYGGVDVQIQVLLTSALFGGEWSGALVPGKEPIIPTE
jgi:hypothetical protein